MGALGSQTVIATFIFRFFFFFNSTFITKEHVALSKSLHFSLLWRTKELKQEEVKAIIFCA